MSWAVLKFSGQGKEEKKLSDEFVIKDFDRLDIKNFRAIKFLDPYGDTTIGSKQFDDLIADLRQLEKKGQIKSDQMNEIVGLINECKRELNSYLKFFGD